MTVSMIQGSVAGLAATVPMTVAMASIRKGAAGKHAALPFEQVATGIADKAGLADNLDHDEQDVFNWTSHFAFGAATGAIYALAARGPQKYALAKGIAYGMAVWSTSYVAVLPAMNVMHFPSHEPKNKIVSEIVSHVVWGAVLGLAIKALDAKMGKKSVH